LLKLNRSGERNLAFPPLADGNNERRRGDNREMDKSSWKGGGDEADEEGEDELLLNV
jgi:hypothetical protein